MNYIWWHKDQSGRKRLVIRKCDNCPCEGCKPLTLATITVDGHGTAYFTEWLGPKIGYPGARWRLVETSDCYLYMSGMIDEEGRLVGLPESFTSDYAYRGILLLQQGCPDEFGVVQWPRVNGCDNLNQSN